MMKKGRHQHKDDDKLSDLPDCLLLHIRSFFSIKDAVRTCLLSTRWKHLWKRLQTLSFTDGPFGYKWNAFNDFANQVLSLHDPSIVLIALNFQTREPVEPYLLKTIEKFAASQNKNLKRFSLFYCGIEKIPNFLFFCHSLVSLKLKCRHDDYVEFPDSLNLPALTYLKLTGLVFRSGDGHRAKPFSRFIKLNSLIIKRCRPTEKDGQTLCISNVMLVDLVIDTRFRFLNIELSTPSLCNFTFNSYLAVIPSWLMELVNLESLTISKSTLEVPDLRNSKHTSWSNLKSLQVILYPYKKLVPEQLLMMMRDRDVNHEVAGGKRWKGSVKLLEAIKNLKPYVSIPDGAIDFFIQNSPSANVDMLIPKQPKCYYFL